MRTATCRLQRGPTRSAPSSRCRYEAERSVSRSPATTFWSLAITQLTLTGPLLNQHFSLQASKINSQLTFEQRKEPKQDIAKLEKEIVDGNTRIDVLRQVC
jgi:hypothetical protein